MKLWDTVFAHHHIPNPITKTDGHSSSAVPCPRAMRTRTPSQLECRKIRAVCMGPSVKRVLLQRRSLGLFIATLLPQFNEVFDRAIIVLLDLGESKAGGVNVRLLCFCVRTMDGTTGFIASAERNVLVFAGHALQVTPFLAADFL